MRGEAGSRSGTGSGSYCTGHGYHSNKTTFKSTVPGIIDSVYVTEYVGNAANFYKVTVALARYVSGLYRKGGTMIAQAMELGELPTNDPPDEPSEYLKVKDERGNTI